LEASRTRLSEGGDMWCISMYWSSPPNRFPFFRNLSFPYLSITRYPNNPDSAESDPITHLHYCPYIFLLSSLSNLSGYLFPWYNSRNYRVIWRHLQITSVPPLV
jgi:hypothetical protein